MLQNIRERITGGWAIAFLVLMAIPFAFFGISGDFTGGSYAAKVEGVEIPVAQLENQYQAELARYAEFGTDLPAELRSLVRQGVLNNLIRETLINVHVSEQGYRISDQMITDFIQRVPEFQVDGRFSKDRYYQWLEERALTPARFEESQRESLRLQQFQRGLAATAFVTPAEYRRYLNLYGEQRRAAIATFDVDTFAEDIEISDEEVASYYEANPVEFRTEESADVDYIEIDRSGLRNQVQITEEQLREYYAQSTNRYLQDESRQARHILIPFGEDRGAAEEQAGALVERARAGEPFEDLARQYSADSSTAEQGGTLDTTLKSQMPEALGNAIFSMDRGEIAGPVESEFGFHVVRLDSIQAGGPLPLEQVRAELENELRDIEAEEAFQDLQRSISDALFDAQDLNQIAATAGLEVRSADGFTRSGGEPFGANQAVIDAVFDPRVLNDGAVSDIVELDANRAAVFQVREHHEAAQQPLDEVRERIVATLRMERARENVRQRALELEATLRSGADFAEAAAAAGAEVTPLKVLSRQDENADPRVLEAIFRAEKPAEGRAVVGNTVSEEGNYAVYSVAAVMPGRPEAIPLEQRDAEKERLTQQAGAADYTAVVLDLERQADIVIADDALAEPEF
ncbi:MAG TPA: SurA N-terminal domain-containing protein [Woeseiaceae bacterium]|nr:SurA N-terminal domain-containing protein [Woeseiaceae bacterium]